MQFPCSMTFGEQQKAVKLKHVFGKKSFQVILFKDSGTGVYQKILLLMFGSGGTKEKYPLIREWLDWEAIILEEPHEDYIGIFRLNLYTYDSDADVCSYCTYL